MKSLNCYKMSTKFSYLTIIIVKQCRLVISESQFTIQQICYSVFLGLKASATFCQQLDVSKTASIQYRPIEFQKKRLTLSYIKEHHTLFILNLFFLHFETDIVSQWYSSKQSTGKKLSSLRHYLLSSSMINAINYNAVGTYE